MRSTFAGRKWSQKAEGGEGGGTLREHVCCGITDGHRAAWTVGWWCCGSRQHHVLLCQHDEVSYRLRYLYRTSLKQVALC